MTTASRDTPRSTPAPTSSSAGGPRRPSASLSRLPDDVLCRVATGLESGDLERLAQALERELPDRVWGSLFLSLGFRWPLGSAGGIPRFPRVPGGPPADEACPPHPAGQPWTWKRELGNEEARARAVTARLQNTYSTYRTLRQPRAVVGADEGVALILAGRPRDVTELDLKWLVSRVAGSFGAPFAVVPEFLRSVLWSCVNLRHLVLPQPSGIESIPFETRLESLQVAGPALARLPAFELDGTRFPQLRYLYAQGFKHVSLRSMPRLYGLELRPGDAGDNVVDLRGTALRELELGNHLGGAPFRWALRNANLSAITSLVLGSQQPRSDGAFRQPWPRGLSLAEVPELSSLVATNVDFPGGELDLSRCANLDCVELWGCTVHRIVFGRHHAGLDVTLGGCGEVTTVCRVPGFSVARSTCHGNVVLELVRSL